MVARNRLRAGKCVILKTAAGGSRGVNGSRGRRVTIIKCSTGNGVRSREIACISDFKMLTLAKNFDIRANC